MTFINQTDLEFKDISTELWRQYRFTNKEIITIDNPLQLHVSESGGHRIFDAQGISHYVSKGWIHLCWKSKEGLPNFVK